MLFATQKKKEASEVFSSETSSAILTHKAKILFFYSIGFELIAYRSLSKHFSYRKKRGTNYKQSAYLVKVPQSEALKMKEQNI